MRGRLSEQASFLRAFQHAPTGCSIPAENLLDVRLIWSWHNGVVKRVNGLGMKRSGSDPVGQAVVRGQQG